MVLVHKRRRRRSFINHQERQRDKILIERTPYQKKNTTTHTSPSWFHKLILSTQRHRPHHASFKLLHQFQYPRSNLKFYINNSNHDICGTELNEHGIDQPHLSSTFFIYSILELIKNPQPSPNYVRNSQNKPWHLWNTNRSNPPFIHVFPLVVAPSSYSFDVSTRNVYKTHSEVRN